MSRRQEQEVTRQHGYEATFDPEIERRYVCPICLLAMRDAVQTKCGHRFCQACLTHSHGTMRFSRCPVDNTWYDTIKDVFLDTAFNREVMSQPVKCNNHVINCTWKGDLRHLQEHVSDCPETEIDCVNECGVRYKRRLRVDHLNACPRRFVACDHCTEDIIAADLLKHQLLECKRFPFNCTMCGQSGLLREQVNIHQDSITGACPMVTVPCAFSPMGCLHKDKRKDMAIHYEVAVQQHMLLLSRQVALCEERLDRQEHHLTDIMSNIEQLLDVSVRHGRALGRQTTDLSDHARRLEEMETTHYTGQLLWRVHIPEDRMTFQVVSPSFYTARPGYKVSIVLEVAGYEHSGVNYASVFIQLEQGIYDDQMTFPYNSSCHVSVIGQDEESNKVHSVTIPCTGMPRCTNGRPPRKICLKFIKLDDLFSTTFLSNDTILLQAFLRDLSN